MTMVEILHGARDMLLPARCSGCRTPGSWFCSDCRDGCEPERLGITKSLTVIGSGVFEGPLREAIHRFKYGDERSLAHELGALVAARLAADVATGELLEVVCPIPLHSSRAAERGYDQALLLAEFVASACGLPLVNALRRIKASAPQVKLDRAARQANIHGAFVGSAGSLRGLRVALVDDVATTGATIRDAAAAARACGARSVRAYVIAVDA